MSSRAYIQVYGPVEESVVFANKLLSLGASIVGNTKMTNLQTSGSMIFVPSALEAISIRAHLVVHLVLRLRWRGIHGSISRLVQIVGVPTIFVLEKHLTLSVAGGSIRAPATANGIFSL